MIEITEDTRQIMLTKQDCCNLQNQLIDMFCIADPKSPNNSSFSLVSIEETFPQIAELYRIVRG